MPHLQSTLSLWYLHSASELQQFGDTGGTTASRQPSERYGIEWANYYKPLKHVAIDFDLANSRALFTETDEDDAATDSPGGKRVPEAVGLVIASVGVEKVCVLWCYGADAWVERGYCPSPFLSSGRYRWCCCPAEEPYQTFDVLGSGRQEELLSDELQPAQAQATKTDVTF